MEKSHKMDENNAAKLAKPTTMTALWNKFLCRVPQSRPCKNIEALYKNIKCISLFGMKFFQKLVKKNKNISEVTML